MNFFELIKLAASLSETLVKLFSNLDTAGPIVDRLLTRFVRPSLYENVTMELVLDIKDRQGRLAVLAKRQRVRFRSADAGPIRDLAWGEGEILSRYEATGAQKLGVQAEGSRQALLLVLPRQAPKGESITVESRRVIRSGFPRPQEYFDTFVERPTRRLALKVLFPRSRPPREACLVSEGRDLQARMIPVRYGQDGRPFLSWRRLSPAQFRTYSLRWFW